MFGRRRSNEPPTSYERQRILNTNQLLCLGVLGILVYQFIQGLLEEGEAPLWFLIAMPLLIVATILIILYNFREIKRLKRYIEEMEEAEKNQQDESENETQLLEVTIQADNDEVSKYDE